MIFLSVWNILRSIDLCGKTFGLFSIWIDKYHQQKKQINLKLNTRKKRNAFETFRMIFDWIKWGWKQSIWSIKKANKRLGLLFVMKCNHWKYARCKWDHNALLLSCKANRPPRLNVNREVLCVLQRMARGANLFINLAPFLFIQWAFYLHANAKDYVFMQRNRCCRRSTLFAEPVGFGVRGSWFASSFFSLSFKLVFFFSMQE